MKNRNRTIGISFIVIAIISALISCGTLGGIDDTIYFPTSKRKLEIAMDSLYTKHPEYKIPEKWKTFDNWHANGYDFLESRIYYFESTPEEMYYVTFIGDSVALADTTRIGIAVRAICNGNSMWILGDSLSSQEKQRIIKRFDNEIVTKLEEYTKTKSTKESPY